MQVLGPVVRLERDGAAFLVWLNRHTASCATLKYVQKKNLTLSLPSELIQAAKVYAAKNGASINALVKESLEQKVRSEDDHMAALTDTGRF